MPRRRRRPTCAHCKADLPEPIRRCLTCRKAYCSPVLRDCAVVHSCKDPAIELTDGLKAALR